MSLSNKSPSGVAVEKFLIAHSAQGLDISRWLDTLISNNRNFENSKVMAYRMLTKAGVPMPASTPFNGIDQLKQLVQRPFPFVVKFDSSYLFGIQTVVVRNETDLAQVYASSELIHSTRGIVQDFCQGKEYTVVALVGSQNWISLGTAVDYKRVSEHAQSLNSFGMGSMSPCTYTAPDTMAVVDLVAQTIRTNFKFRGVLCCQFLLDTASNLWFLEYNMRFCDSESQSILPSLGPEAARALVQLYHDEPMQPVPNHNVNAVTVCLVNQHWPEPQQNRAELVLDANPFDVALCHSVFDLNYDLNTYWGSITNSGPGTHAQLAQEVYDFLQTQNLGPYRYRIDIGQ